MEKNKKDIDSSLTNIVFGAGITFTGIIVGGGLQYLYHIVLARYLGPDKLGIFVLGITIVTIASTLSRLGLDIGILRHVAIFKGERDEARVKGTVVEALKYSGTASMIIAVCLFVLASFISQKIFRRQELSSVLQILCFSMPFSVLMTMFLATCQAFFIARYTALIQNFLYPLMNIILAFAAMILGWNLLGFVAGYLVSTVLAFGLAGYFLLKIFPEIRGGSPGIVNRKELMMFSAPLLGVSFLNHLILWTDTIMLGYFKHSHDVGIYSAAAKTSMLLLLLLYSMNFIFAPLISELYNKNEIDRLEGMFKIVARWSITFAYPMLLFMAYQSVGVLRIFSMEFTAASTALIILAFGQFINVSTGSVVYMLIMTGRSWLMLILSFFSLGLNLILNYVLIPRYGIIGASVATASSISVINLLCLFSVYKIMKLHPYHLSHAKPLFGATAALWITRAIVDRIGVEWPMTLLLSLLFFICLYLVSLILFGFSKEDKDLIQSVKSRLWGI